jgi:hypothetical protein
MERIEKGRVGHVRFILPATGISGIEAMQWIRVGATLLAMGIVDAGASAAETPPTTRCCGRS